MQSHDSVASDGRYVQQRYADRPHDERTDGDRQRRGVFVRITIECQIVEQVTAGVPRGVLKPVCGVRQQQKKLTSQRFHARRSSYVVLRGSPHRNVLKIRVAVVGTRIKVTTRAIGSACCNPALTAARRLRVARSVFRSLRRSRRSSQPMLPAVAARMRPRGQIVETMSRLMYGPKQGAGMRRSAPKSAGSSRRLIQKVYASRPAGVTTSKTLGTAATH
eukprot:7386906-Prymnesium_polylepis.3